MNEELLKAISDMMDEKLTINQQETHREMRAIIKPLKDQLESLDIKVDTLQLNMQTLQLNVKTSERAIKKRIDRLDDEMETLIAVLEAKNILKYDGKEHSIKLDWREL